VTEQDKQFIVALVSEMLAVHAPEEVAIYEVASDDMLRQARKSLEPAADGDSYFGGLELSLGEILTHTLALIVADLAIQGLVLSRNSVRDYLHKRQEAAAESAARTAAAQKQIREFLDARAAAGETPPVY